VFYWLVGVHAKVLLSEDDEERNIIALSFTVSIPDYPLPTSWRMSKDWVEAERAMWTPRGLSLSTSSSST
jgi:hypothetical protein